MRVRRRARELHFDDSLCSSRLPNTTRSSWLCQNFFGSYSASLVILIYSPMKSANKDVFDSVNLVSDVTRGQAGDLRDRRSIEVFQIKEHDRAIGRFQPMDQPHQFFQRHLLICEALVIGFVRRYFDIFESNQTAQFCTVLPDDISHRGIVSDAINPCSKRTARLITIETSPHSEVNFLEQVSPLFRVGFVHASETAEGGAVSGRNFAVQAIPI